MLAEMMRRKRLILPGLTALLLAGGLALWGCADHPTSYEDPADKIVTTHTPTALIEAATLQQWIDEGRLNSTDPDSRDKVVIITVSTAAAYNTGHIAGSQLWNYDTEIFQTRLEGVAAMSSMVMTGPVLDALLRRSGIDENTTVVFTASTTGSARDLREATRGWWTLRYWGFPKDRIKVLQGGDVGWTEAGNTLVPEVPTIAPSDFSVRDLAGSNRFGADLRASIGEIMRAVDGVNSGALTDVAFLDTRGGVDPATGGKMQPAVLDSWNGYYVAGTSGTLKPVDELVARLAGFGVTESTAMSYVSCQGGVKCTVVFFVLDGMLDWPVQSYDGSWGQWSGYSNASIAAAWKVDANSPGTTISRSFGTWTAGSPAIDPIANGSYPISDPRANQIENEDAAYFSSGGASVPPTTGGGGGGSGSGC